MLASSVPGKRGVSRSSRTRDRMRWTRQRRRGRSVRGAVFRERATARRTNGAVSGFAKTSSEGYQARRSLLAKTGCVRQNRVVPTPVAGAKLPVATSIRPDRSAIKPAATVTRRIRRRGRARHKPSNHCAGNVGLPPLNLYARVRISLCNLHTRPRVQRAPGFPCALFSERGRIDR